MATTLALAMRASMSAGGVVSGANDAARAMDRMGRQAQQTARDVSVLKNLAIGAVLFKGVSMAADAFVSTGRAVVGYAANAANALDTTNDLANRLGMGVESLQALQMAAKLSGIDDATGALQKLTVAIGKAAESGKTKAFENLGLNFSELQAMSPEEQFRAVQAAIAALPTPTQQAAAAVKIFGKSGVELLPLMSQNLAEVEARMRRLGAVVGTDQVEAIASMNDSLDMVQATFNGIIGQVVGHLAPAIEEVANQFLLFVENFEGGGTGIAEGIAQALISSAKYMAQVFDGFLSGLGEFLVGLGAWVSSDIEKIGKKLKAVGDAGYLTAAADLTQQAFDNRFSEKNVNARKAREAERKAAREAAAAEEKAQREADAAKKIQDDAAKKVAAIDEKIASKRQDVVDIQANNATALSGKSNQALKASDIRSSEGMAQFIALATGRDDPAIEESRKTNQKLEEIRAELRALANEKVDILGAAA